MDGIYEVPPSPLITLLNQQRQLYEDRPHYPEMVRERVNNIEVRCGNFIVSYNPKTEEFVMEGDKIPEIDEKLDEKRLREIMRFANERGLVVSQFKHRPYIGFHAICFLNVFCKHLKIWHH